jgi:hypothetical protein
MMADDSTPTPRKAVVRAGGTLDLSTGAPAPPPPEPAPLPPAPTDTDVKAGRTLNLSTGKAPSAPRRKPAAASLGPGPVVRETLDLSTKTAAPAAEAASPAPPKASKPSGSRGKGGRRDDRSSGKNRKRGEAPTASGESLADLLDPDVLAKLRGG